MRIWPILALSFTVISAPVLSAPQPLGTMWQAGGTSLVRSQCKSDILTINIAVPLIYGMEGAADGSSGGYMSARLVWSAPHGHGSPDALVIGETGGSGGYAELFAITAGPTVQVEEAGRRAP